MNLPEGRFGIGGHAPDALLVAHVEIKCKHAPAQRFDLRCKFRKGLAFAAGEHQIGSGFRQGPRKVLSQAAAGAGNDGHLAGQIEEFVVGRLSGLAFMASESLSSDSVRARAAAKTSADLLRAERRR